MPTVAQMDDAILKAKLLLPKSLPVLIRVTEDCKVQADKMRGTDTAT